MTWGETRRRPFPSGTNPLWGPPPSWSGQPRARPTALRPPCPLPGHRKPGVHLRVRREARRRRADPGGQSCLQAPQNSPAPQYSGLHRWAGGTCCSVRLISAPHFLPVSTPASVPPDSIPLSTSLLIKSLTSPPLPPPCPDIPCPLFRQTNAST